MAFRAASWITIMLCALFSVQLGSSARVQRATAEPIEIAIIANPSTDQKTLDQLTLRHVFTGRTKVWSAIAERETTLLQELFGTGLGNKSFGGLAIDSNWVATNLELGRVGVALVVVFLLALPFRFDPSS